MDPRIRFTNARKMLQQMKGRVDGGPDRRSFGNDATAGAW